MESEKTSSEEIYMARTDTLFVANSRVACRIKQLPHCLHLDDFSGCLTLAAVNSKLYAIGTFSRVSSFMDFSKTVPKWNVVSLRRQGRKKKRWLRISCPVAGQDGCLYVLNSIDGRIERIRHDSDGRMFIQIVLSADDSRKKLIAVSNNRIFTMTGEEIIYHDRESKQQHTLATSSYDLNWELFSYKFLVYDNGRYLCLFKYSREELMMVNGPNEYKFVGGIHVYDTNLQEWLPEVVQGLPTDGIILPHPSCESSLLDRVDLFQLGTTHNGSPKLALVWNSEDADGFYLRFCKFTIHDEEQGKFKAEILLAGCYHLDHQIGRLINCTAGVSMMNNTMQNDDTSAEAWDELVIHKHDDGRKNNKRRRE